MRNVGGVAGVTGGSFPARIWGAFNTAYHEGRPVKPFVAPGPTRPGRVLRTPQEQAELERFARSACGSDDAEVDTDGDGTPDACAPGTITPYRDDTCPRLLVPIDTDGDGEPDSCVPRATGGTVTPPATGTGGATTTVPPAGSVPSTTVPSPPSRGT
jgi:hypothetical protein